jgi:hypothetical protein
MPPAYLLGPEVAPDLAQRSGGSFCLGKTRHHGPQVAYEIIKRRNRRGRATRRRDVPLYRCAGRGHWHLGSQFRRPKRKAR